MSKSTSTAATGGPEDEQRVAKVKADIRALDAAIDTAFFGVSPAAGPSSPRQGGGDVNRNRSGSRSTVVAESSNVGGGRRGSSAKKGKGHSEDFDGPDDIPLRRKSSPQSFGLTPLHYESVPPDANPQYENQYDTEEPVTLARRLFFYGFRECLFCFLLLRSPLALPLCSILVYRWCRGR